MGGFQGERFFIWEAMAWPKDRSADVFKTKVQQWFPRQSLILIVIVTFCATWFSLSALEIIHPPEPHSVQISTTLKVWGQDTEAQFKHRRRLLSQMTTSRRFVMTGAHCTTRWTLCARFAPRCCACSANNSWVGLWLQQTHLHHD